MNIAEMYLNDIENVLELYVDYCNNHEEGCWTKETARKRIHQVLSIEDSYSLIMKKDDGNVIGFAMGYFKQYDDIMRIEMSKKDADRTAFLEGYGLRVIRVPNNGVGRNFCGVCAYIDAAVKQSLSQLR